jgi:membrane fusion protein (multidrug efflux system)
MRKPSSRVLIGCLGVLTAGLAPGCRSSDRASASPSPPPAHVQVVRVKVGEIVRKITLPGNVRAYQETTLYAKVPGYLKSIAVDRGDWVKANDVLAEIEAPETLADVAKFQAEARVAEQELRRVNEAFRKAPDLVMPKAVDRARGTHEIAKANLQRIETLLAYSKIVAPFDGVVTRRWVDRGAFIPAATSSSAARNAAVVTMMDFSRVRIDVAVPQPEVPLVRNALPVDVTVQELPGRVFEGKITRYAYALDEATKTMTAEIEIPNPDHALRPGMYASCRIALQAKPNAPLIPAEALVTEKQKTFVFSVRDDKAVRLPVRIGFDDGVTVEVLEGLQVNDPVVVAGKQAIADGQEVKVTEAP